MHANRFQKKTKTKRRLLYPDKASESNEETGLRIHQTSSLQTFKSIWISHVCSRHTADSHSLNLLPPCRSDLPLVAALSWLTYIKLLVPVKAALIQIVEEEGGGLMQPPQSGESAADDDWLCLCSVRDQSATDWTAKSPSENKTPAEKHEKWNYLKISFRVIICDLPKKFKRNLDPKFYRKIKRLST